MNFEQILLNKDFCMMFGLVVIEGMTLSGHPWIINEIGIYFCVDHKKSKFKWND